LLNFDVEPFFEEGSYPWQNFPQTHRHPGAATGVA
jgi:hypothetical protein